MIVVGVSIPKFRKILVGESRHNTASINLKLPEMVLRECAKAKNIFWWPGGGVIWSHCDLGFDFHFEVLLMNPEKDKNDIKKKNLFTK